jgi:hypothetical protein
MLFENGAARQCLLVHAVEARSTIGLVREAVSGSYDCAGGE